MIDILINNELQFDCDTDRLRGIVLRILQEHEVQAGEVSLAIVDDPTIHQLNRQHLQHDYPTDVLSFVLDPAPEAFEGEVIVSSDTARTQATQYNWDTEHELLMYFVHGTLHLVGYDDHNDADRQAMREQEIHYLQQLQIFPPADHALRMQPAGQELDT